MEELPTVARNDDASRMDEVPFLDWSGERLRVYQQLEQQVQAQIAGTLQLAGDLHIRMEQESQRLLDGYRRQRDTYQEQLDTLRQTMAAERSQHQAELEAERLRVEQQLSEQRQQATEQHEQDLAATRVRIEQMLAQAHTERERVRAETREMSRRLEGLQHSLRGLLGDASLPAPAHEPVSDSVQTPGPAELEAPLPATVSAVQEEATPEAPDGVAVVWIAPVFSLMQASDLIDVLERQESVESVTLSQYEQMTLQLQVYLPPSAAPDQVVRAALYDQAEQIETRRGGTYVRLHA